MLMVDYMFIVVVIPLALIFTLVAFHYKGLVWMPFIPAVLWVIVGLFLITRPAVITYQNYFSLLFFGLAFAVLFAPYYLGAKHIDIEEQEEETPRQRYIKRMRNNKKRWGEIAELRKINRREEQEY